MQHEMVEEIEAYHHELLDKHDDIQNRIEKKHKNETQAHSNHQEPYERNSVSNLSQSQQKAYCRPKSPFPKNVRVSVANSPGKYIAEQDLRSYEPVSRSPQNKTKKKYYDVFVPNNDRNHAYDINNEQNQERDRIIKEELESSADSIRRVFNK